MNTTSTTQQTFPLVKGEFGPDDAKKILMNLLNKKIEFHLAQDFSHQEKFGQSDARSANRIKELRQTQSTILQLIGEAESQGKSLRLTSDIHLEITE